MTLLFLTLFACQDPFGSDRHTLEGNRIAAIEAQFDGSVVSLRPSLVVDGALWSDATVELAWSWLGPDDNAATWSEAANITGPWSPLAAPQHANRVLLLATFPGDDVAKRAVIDLPSTTLGAMVLVPDALNLHLDSVEAKQLGQDQRLRQETVAWTLQEPGDLLRWTAQIDVAEDARAHWMSTGGTWFELAPTIADLALGTLVVDGDEITQADAIEAGWLTVLVSVTQTGASTWKAADLPVGIDEVGGFVQQRWLPDAQLGLRWVEFVADDAAPMGLRAIDQGPADASEPDGTDSLGCLVTGPFSPDWLAEGRCTRAQIAEHRLQVQVESW
ncbi:MAG: hypothetical protein GWP91_08670 [Rhodobacterales bacterium]|nr:hypothetical protein [Rhodobacterales bacterium]